MFNCLWERRKSFRINICFCARNRLWCDMFQHKNIVDGHGKKIFFAPLRRRWIYDDPSEWVATICWEIVEHSFGLTRLRNLFAFVYLFLSRLERKMCEELANRRKRQRAKIVWSTIERCWNMWSIHMRPREINEKVVSRVNSYFRLFNWLYLPVNSMVQACCTWIPLARKIGEIRCVAKSRKGLSINMWNLTYFTCDV